MGSGVWGLGVGVWSFGFGRVIIVGGLRVLGNGSWVLVSSFRVKSSGYGLRYETHTFYALPNSKPYALTPTPNCTGKPCTLSPYSSTQTHNLLFWFKPPTPRPQTCFFSAVLTTAAGESVPMYPPPPHTPLNSHPLALTSTPHPSDNLQFSALNLASKPKQSVSLLSPTISRKPVSFQQC